jgi:hypothetical protein
MCACQVLLLEDDDDGDDDDDDAEDDADDADDADDVDDVDDVDDDVMMCVASSSSSTSLPVVCVETVSNGTNIITLDKRARSSDQVLLS